MWKSWSFFNCRNRNRNFWSFVAEHQEVSETAAWCDVACSSIPPSAGILTISQQQFELSKVRTSTVLNIKNFVDLKWKQLIHIWSSKTASSFSLQINCKFGLRSRRRNFHFCGTFRHRRSNSDQLDLDLFYRRWTYGCHFHGCHFHVSLLALLTVTSVLWFRLKVQFEKTISTKHLCTVFKRVVPKGRYHTLSVITISLCVSICVSVELGGG